MMKHSIQLNDSYKIKGDFSDQLERRVRILESGISTVEEIQENRGWFHKVSDFFFGPSEPELYLAQAKYYLRQSRQFLKIGYFKESYRLLQKSAETFREYHQEFGTYLIESASYESKIAFGIKCASTVGALLLTAVVFSPLLPYLPFAIELAVSGGALGAVKAGVGLIAGGIAVYSSASLIGRGLTPGEKILDIPQFHKDMRVGAFIGLGSFLAPFAGVAGGGLASGTEGATRFFLQNLPMAGTAATLSATRVYSEERDLKKAVLVAGVSVAASYAAPAIILGENRLRFLNRPESVRTETPPVQISSNPLKNPSPANDNDQVVPANDNAYTLGDPLVGRPFSSLPIMREAASFNVPYQGGSAAPQLQPTFYQTPLVNSSLRPNLNLVPSPMQPAPENLIDLRARDLLTMPVLSQEWISLWDVQQNRVKNAADLQREKWMEKLFETNLPNLLDIQMSHVPEALESAADLSSKDSEKIERAMKKIQEVAQAIETDPLQLTSGTIDQLVELSLETRSERVLRGMYAILNALVQQPERSELVGEMTLLRLLDKSFHYFPLTGETDQESYLNVTFSIQLVELLKQVLTNPNIRSVQFCDSVLKKFFAQQAWLLYGPVWLVHPALGIIHSIEQKFPHLLQPSMIGELVAVILWSCERKDRAMVATILRELQPSYIQREVLEYLIQYTPQGEVQVSREVLKYLVRQEWFRGILTLTLLEFRDGGRTYSPITRFMRDYVTAPISSEDPIVLEDFSYSTQKVNLNDFLRAHAAEVESPKPLGRSVIYKIAGEKNLLVLKYLNPDQDPKDSIRELLYQQRMNAEPELGVYLPEPILGHRQMPTLWEFEGGKKAIAFIISSQSQYYRYFEDPSLTFSEFSASLKSGMQTLFRLAKRDVYHTSLAPLFHNSVSSNRFRQDQDRGMFLVGIDFVEKDAFGMGNLDNYEAAFSLGNVGVSGPRDAEHWARFREIVQNVPKWMFGYQSLLNRSNAEALLQTVLFGNYYFFAMHQVGLRMKRESEKDSSQSLVQHSKDDQWLKPYADLLLDIYSTGYSETKKIPIEEAQIIMRRRVDWLRFARALVFNMTNAYVPYVQEGANPALFPTNIYPETVFIPRFGPYRTNRFNSIRGFLGTDLNQALGTVNGPFQLKEPFETAWLATILDPDDP